MPGKSLTKSNKGSKGNKALRIGMFRQMGQVSRSVGGSRLMPVISGEVHGRQISFANNSPTSAIDLSGVDPMDRIESLLALHRTVIDAKDPHERLLALPASVWDSFDTNLVRLFAVASARYFLPTVEVLDLVQSLIAGRNAIEIGAGQGDFGRLLGIPMTDSYMQQSEMFKQFAALHGPLQTPTSPPPDVEKSDALAAVRRHRPQVVVAAWVTEKFRQQVHTERSAALLGGVDEIALMESGIETYIHVGHRGSHGEKTILRLAHDEYVLPGHRSRAEDTTGNVICVWNRKKR